MELIPCEKFHFPFKKKIKKVVLTFVIRKNVNEFGKFLFLGFILPEIKLENMSLDLRMILYMRGKSNFKFGVKPLV